VHGLREVVSIGSYVALMDDLVVPARATVTELPTTHAARSRQQASAVDRGLWVRHRAGVGGRGGPRLSPMFEDTPAPRVRCSRKWSADLIGGVASGLRRLRMTGAEPSIGAVSLDDCVDGVLAIASRTRGTHGRAESLRPSGSFPPGRWHFSWSWGY
jgi:hypothetical protein